MTIRAIRRCRRDSRKLSHRPLGQRGFASFGVSRLPFAQIQELGDEVDLETVYYIGQTIAVIVIIATLIALLIQTRQTNKLAIIETSRSNIMTFVAEQYQLFRTPEDAAFMHKALYTSERLSDEEKARFGFTKALVFGWMETGQMTHKTGLFRETDYVRAIDTLRLQYLSSPRARKWWRNSRRNYAKNPDFAALIDGLAAEAEAADAKLNAE